MENLLAARRQTVFRIDVGDQHDIRADGNGLPCDPVPELDVTIRLVGNLPVYGQRHIVPRAVLALAISRRSVILAHVQVAVRPAAQPIRDDLVHDSFVGHAEMNEIIAGPPGIASFPVLEVEILGMRIQEALLPVRKGMPVTDMFAILQAHTQAPQSPLIQTLLPTVVVHAEYLRRKAWHELPDFIIREPLPLERPPRPELRLGKRGHK